MNFQLLRVRTEVSAEGRPAGRGGRRMPAGRGGRRRRCAVAPGRGPLLAPAAPAASPRAWPQWASACLGAPRDAREGRRAWLAWRHVVFLDAGRGRPPGTPGWSLGPPACARSG